MSNVKSTSMHTWSIICILFIILIGANTYISSSTVNELRALQQDVRNTGDIRAVLSRLYIDFLTVETRENGYLLEMSQGALREFNSALDKAQNSLKKLTDIQSDLNNQKILIDQVAKLINNELNALQGSIDKAQASEQQDDEMGKNLLGRLPNQHQRYAKIRELFETISANEEAYRTQLSTELQKVVAESRTTLIISLITSILLVVGIFFLARMNIQFQRKREREIEEQNADLFFAVEERTRELSIYSEELKRSNRELEDFAFVASHDLQEPLRKIQTFGDRLQTQFKEQLGDKGSDYLKRMQKAAIRMSKLINDLLEFSRVSSRGKAFTKTDLNSIVKDCQEDLSLVIEEKQAKLDYECLPEVDADPLQMQQLFYNLVANALKFSHAERNPIIEITVKAGAQPADINQRNLENWVRIIVKDNGIGFEQNYADKIFAPFQRLHSRNEYEGTGIGLSVCRRIVERHNGRITAQSEAGEGSEFIIDLPCSNQLLSIGDKA
ncbi:sensor histidine kinase [Ningiella sp. W23]|uniref:sensor histidine kinase n=1 Tax=Ningiella sp. W23 TaxID=3023715 RepID=UPI0037573BB0